MWRKEKENSLSCDCNCCAKALSSRTIHSRHTANKMKTMQKHLIQFKVNICKGLKNWFCVNNLLSLNLIANGKTKTKTKTKRRAIKTFACLLALFSNLLGLSIAHRFKQEFFELEWIFVGNSNLNGALTGNQFTFHGFGNLIFFRNIQF